MPVLVMLAVLPVLQHAVAAAHQIRAAVQRYLQQHPATYQLVALLCCPTACAA
jgi:hypothetical protein